MSTPAPAQAPIIRQFIHALNMLPDHASQADVEHALSPALQYEELLRYKLDPRPYIGLLDVFDIPTHCLQPRLRRGNSIQEYLFPINKDSLCAEEYTFVTSLWTFKRNFEVFTHGVLRLFHDWDNVIVAGGSVLAALVHSAEIPKADLIRKFHTAPYQSSDVDIFIWGLSHTEAEKKVDSIFKAVKSSVPWDVVAVCKANVISIHTQYPCRPVQIVLRLYQSPTEVLIGFDVDCCSVCYDGESVWATPRALTSILLRRLPIDMTRRSPSYEIRIAKYARRGFEVYYPKLQRGNINPSLYECDLASLPTGLARLLVLEHMSRNPEYYRHIKTPGVLPVSLATGIFPLLKNAPSDDDYTSNYEHAAFQIPYALNWDAKCIKKLDRRTVSSSIPTKEITGQKHHFTGELACHTGEYLHRHVMRAYDDITHCFDDVCGNCPEPRNEEEEQEQKKNDTKYVHGHLKFLVQNPGQQLITSSFNPINDSDWEQGAYLN